MEGKQLRYKVIMSLMGSVVVMSPVGATGSDSVVAVTPTALQEQAAVTTAVNNNRGIGVTNNEVYDFGSGETVALETERTYAGGEVSRVNRMGILGNRDFMDTPFNVTGYTSELIENQQAKNIIDVATNDPSVNDLTLSGASNAWVIRGIKMTQQDVQFNGLYGIAPRFYTGVEALDRVEILKGPAAMLSGMSPNDSVGGTVNFVPKRAGDLPINRVTLTYGDGNQVTEHLDIGRRFNDGKVGVRMNILNRGGGDTATKNEKNKASTFALGVDAKGDRYRTSFDFGYVYNDIENPQYRVTFGNAFIKAGGTDIFSPQKDAKYGAPGTYRRVTEKYGVWRGEYDVSDNWTAYAAFGMRNTSMDYLYNNFQVLSPNGNSSLKYQHNRQFNRGISAEVGVRGTEVIGALTHELSVSASRISYKRFMNNVSLNTIKNIDFYNPTWGSIKDTSVSEYPLSDKNVLRSIGISDMISTADRKWQFLVGGRFQQANTDNYDTKTGNESSHYDKSAFSPVFGVVHKINDRISMYGNSSQGLSAGDIVTDENAKNYGEAMAPYKTKQYEVGAKFDWGKVAMTVSAFDMRRSSMIYNASTNYYTADGKQRNRGVEVNVFGEPKTGTRLVGGVAFLDARMTNTEGGTYNGKRAAGIPSFTGTLGVEQDITSVPGLTINGRVVYNGSAYADSANRLKVDPWVRVDLGARYRFNWNQTPMTLRADVYNVLDKTYWRALDNNSVFLANGRTFVLSMSADF